MRARNGLTKILTSKTNVAIAILATHFDFLAHINVSVCQADVTLDLFQTSNSGKQNISPSLCQKPVLVTIDTFCEKVINAYSPCLSAGAEGSAIAHGLLWRDQSTQGFLTQRRNGAKAQRGQPQPKNLNRSKQRKQRRKNFAKNAQFSEIALRRRIRRRQAYDRTALGFRRHFAYFEWFAVKLCPLCIYHSAFIIHHFPKAIASCQLFPPAPQYGANERLFLCDYGH